MYQRFTAGLLTFVMTLSLTACGGEPQAAPGAGAEPVAAAQTEQLTPWEESSQIFATDETDAELYEKAKAEGEVTIYSITSRIQKVAAAFEAKYPGVKCNFFDISNNELLEKVTREYDAGVHNADVVHIKDSDGTLWNEYISAKKFYNFKPADILSHIDPELTKYSTPLYIELTQLFYNTEANPDGSPVRTLWDLTLPEWKGRILMANITDNLAWLSWAASFCTGDVPQQLADAYQEQFGEELVLSEGCENAGYEFLKRLHDNDPVYGTNSDAIAEAVGTPGQAHPPVGFTASSKYRNAENKGWVFAPTDLTPSIGLPSVNTLYVVGECEHPNAAKLLIRFMMGGVDGDLSGYEQFNTLGGWPVRDDIPAVEGQTPLDELHVAPFDPMAIYETVNDVGDFWTLLNDR